MGGGGGELNGVRTWGLVVRAVEAGGCADGVHPAAAVPLMLYRSVGVSA